MRPSRARVLATAAALGAAPSGRATDPSARYGADTWPRDSAFTKIRLDIADDHFAVRTGLRAMLGTEPEFHVVGEATSGAQAVRLAGRLRPDKKSA